MHVLEPLPLASTIARPPANSHPGLVSNVLDPLYFPVARATTHSDLLLRARQQGVSWRVVHNASILTAVGASGLQVSGWAGPLDPPSHLAAVY